MTRDYLKLENIFDKSELKAFIEKYDPAIPKNKLLGVLGENIDKFRVAEGIWIQHKDSICDRFKYIVAGVTGLPIENQEDPHLIKYDVGGEYKHHFDYFHPNTDYYDDHIKKGGQRVFSSILYLNDDFEGGETDFPKLDIIVKPVAGSVFTWRNITVDGDLKKDSIHAGLPVTKGIKYILIIWTRENEFNNVNKVFSLKNNAKLKNNL